MAQGSLAPRRVQRVVSGQPTSDGAGVRLTRVIGSNQLLDVDPFLLLDEFRSDDSADYGAGFPDHPHRGFETVTYMLAGRMRHRDSKGNSGLLGPGSVQWMTAGRGLVHSEMPEQEDGLLWGFQLWVNLPARDKMIAPRYQDIPAKDVPQATLPSGGSVRVVAGRYGDAVGPVSGVATEPLYLDVKLGPSEVFSSSLPVEHSAFAYVFEGSVGIGADRKNLSRGQLALLEDTGGSFGAAAGPEGARFLLVAGRPLHEPVARYGPFVMNTHEEIRQAVVDFRAGQF